MEDKASPVNRRADPVMFGFDFQINAAIVLMLKNIKSLETIRIEGNYEDIELQLKDGERILAQAKGVQKGSSDFRKVRENLKKALLTLSEGGKRAKAKQLIFITNSFNPFNDDASKGIFSGPPSYRTYDSLPESSRKIIDDYLESMDNPLDTNKLLIQTLPFETDDEDERYKYVLREIENFIGTLQLSTPGISKKLMMTWQNDLDHNGSKKDAEIRLKKEDLIWPILVIITDVEPSEEFVEYLDSDIYDDVVDQYKDLISSCCERYEFFKDILSDFNSFKAKTEHKRNKEMLFEFIDSYWKNYIYGFDDAGIDDEVQEPLVKIILYNVITKRRKIDCVKKGVNL